MEYLLVCRSITYAKKVHGYLDAAGIPAVIVRTPVLAVSESCGYSVRIDSRWYESAIARLSESGLKPQKVLIHSGERYIRVM